MFFVYYIIVEFARKVENFQVHCTNYSYVFTKFIKISVVERVKYDILLSDIICYRYSKRISYA